MWWPSCFYGIILRGVYTDMVGLKPVYWLGPALVAILLLGTIMVAVQSRKGALFFLPKSCIPGYHQFLVNFDKLPPQKREDECIICYYPLDSLPSETESTSQAGPSEANEGVMATTEIPMFSAAGSSQALQSTPSQPLMKKLKTCMVTPCKHYFHESCLILWVEKKNECPVCRTQLKFYG